MKKVKRPITTYEEIELYSRAEVRDILLDYIFKKVVPKYDPDEELKSKDKQIFDLLASALNHCDNFYLCQLLDLIPYNAELDNTKE